MEKEQVWSVYFKTTIEKKWFVIAKTEKEAIELAQSGERKPTHEGSINKVWKAHQETK